MRACSMRQKTALRRLLLTLQSGFATPLGGLSMGSVTPRPADCSSSTVAHLSVNETAFQGLLRAVHGMKAADDAAKLQEAKVRALMLELKMII